MQINGLPKLIWDALFLFYTGYMTNIEGQATSELPLADGGSVSATDAAGYLEDVMNNSGYRLASDFRNLWPYSYVNIASGDTTTCHGQHEERPVLGRPGWPFTYISVPEICETMFVQGFPSATGVGIMETFIPTGTPLFTSHSRQLTGTFRTRMGLGNCKSKIVEYTGTIMIQGNWVLFFRWESLLREPKIIKQIKVTMKPVSLIKNIHSSIS